MSGGRWKRDIDNQHHQCFRVSYCRQQPPLYNYQIKRLSLSLSLQYINIYVPTAVCQPPCAVELSHQRSQRNASRRTQADRQTDKETEKNDISVGLSHRISFLVIVIFVTFIPGAELQEEFSKFKPARRAEACIKTQNGGLDDAVYCTV